MLKKIRFFQKACPEVLRDRIFSGASMSKKSFEKIGFLAEHLCQKKIRFFQKACPEVLRDRIFSGASMSKKSDF
jgi:tRNA isopentenyl-2-thiomethyl-A-37 hydroxylase MiaE